MTRLRRPGTVSEGKGHDGLLNNNMKNYFGNYVPTVVF